MKIKAAIFYVVLAVPGVAVADRASGTPDDWAPPMHTPGPYWMVLGDRTETGFGDGEESYVWDVQGWYGSDWNRLRWKTEGEGEGGESPEEAELQLLYSRLFSPYWEWQLGVRHDFEPGSGRSHLVAGLQGVAPYEFEVDAAVFVSEDGDVSARLEAEYDLLLTQRLILQPRLEINAAFNDVTELAIARGVNNTELGIRLRYEIRRELAPYLGIDWSQSYGRTADIARMSGEHTSRTAIVAGLRFWF
jgi:copper resistance protein B